MRMTIRAAASLVLGFAGIIVLGLGVNRLIDAGSCSSGGPSTIARQCPQFTTPWSLLLPIGFVVAMAGLVLSRGGLVRPGTGQIIWTAGFAGGGTAMLVKTLTADLHPSATAGLSVVAVLLILMGLAVGVAGVVQLVRARRGDPRAPRRPKPAATPIDPAAARMKQLHKLRSSGALTRAEFQRLRQDPAGDRLARIQRLADLKSSGALTTSQFEAEKQAALRGSSSLNP